MSLFWKKKQSDETGEDMRQDVAPKSRKDRVKENAQSWLNLESDAEMLDDKSDQKTQLFREGVLEASSGPSRASKNNAKALDPALFSLETDSLSSSNQNTSRSSNPTTEEQATVPNAKEGRDASLFDLDSKLFKNASESPMVSDSKETPASQKKKVIKPDDTDRRVLAFKSVKPNRKAHHPKVVPSKKAETKTQLSSEALRSGSDQEKAEIRQKTPRIVAKPTQKLSIKAQGASAEPGDGATTSASRSATRRVNPQKINSNNGSESKAAKGSDRSKADASSGVTDPDVNEGSLDSNTTDSSNTKRLKISPKVSPSSLKKAKQEPSQVSASVSKDASISTSEAEEKRGEAVSPKLTVKSDIDSQTSHTNTDNKVNSFDSEQDEIQENNADVLNRESTDTAARSNAQLTSNGSVSQPESEGLNETANKEQPASQKVDTDEAKPDAAASKWHKHLEKLETVDPLVDCLVSLSKHFDNPYSADGIRAGLPISDQGMTPELFMRAAKRVGFVTRFVKRPLKKIADVLLPVVLLLENNQACVLIEIDSEHEQAKVFLPESGEGEVYLPISQLLSMYTGYCFFVRPQFRFDKRSMSSTELQLNGKHWFWGTLTSSWRIYRDVIIASLLINLFAIASPLFVMNVYDRVVPNSAFDTLWVLAIGATVVYGFDFLLRSLRSYFIDVAGKKSDILMSATIFAKVNNITMAARPRSVGAFAKNLQDFESIRDFITSASVTTLVDIPFMFLIVGMIYLIGGPVGYIPIVTIILVLIYSLIIQRPLKRSIEEGQKTSMQKNAVLIESLANAESVKLNNAQGTLQQQWEQAVGNISDWGLKTRQLAQSSSSFAMVAQQMTTVGMVVVGVYMISEREMSMGALVACVMLTGRALGPMSQFASLAARYNHAKSAYNGLKDIMASPVEQPDELKFVHRPRFDGSFEFDGVSFAYPEQDQDAISNINLHINAGEKVAIIGRIGSGKSTLGKLMMGLYAPKTGALRADGIDMRQINPVDLRRNVGAVSQDVSLFYGSIKDNICFGVPFIEDEAIIRAAELSGVSEFANRKSSGLDSIVGERGHQLSGGQRQSVAIARALLFDPNILVLDEPTASMDNTTEARMRKRLVDVVKDKTLILITHKSSMLDLVDRVVVMDNGKILADGPKEHVLEALRQGKLKVS